MRFPLAAPSSSLSPPWDQEGGDGSPVLWETADHTTMGVQSAHRTPTRMSSDRRKWDKDRATGG